MLLQYLEPTEWTNRSVLEDICSLVALSAGFLQHFLCFGVHRDLVMNE